jgi:hypothetical protein
MAIGYSFNSQVLKRRLIFYEKRIECPLGQDSQEQEQAQAQTNTRLCMRKAVVKN